MEEEVSGASPQAAKPALVASDQAASRLAPTGFDPARGPWLLWSRYHSAWHRGSVDQDGREHAGGYTVDILDAGIFSEATARAYHGDGRNTAIPLADETARIRERVMGHERQLSVARRLMRLACESQQP